MHQRITASKREILHGQKLSFFEYFFVFVLIIYAGQANMFVRTSEFSTNPIAYTLPIALTIFLMLKWKVRFDNRFLALGLCYFLYCIAITLKYQEIHPSILLDYLFIFFIVFTTIKALGLRIFEIFRYLMLRLAVIALFLWCVQTVLGGDTLYGYLSKIPGIDSFSFVSGDGGINTILYSLQPTSTSILYGIAIPRNCGFAWEPGGFAVYLSLAIFISLFMNKSKNKMDTYFWILTLTLFSTQSTTGYSIFIVMILFHYINEKSQLVLIIFPLLICLIALSFALPFMSNKIFNFIDEAKDTKNIIWQSIGNESESTPQRFSSFLISLKNFYKDPILGNGGVIGKSYLDKIDANLSPISGLGNLMSRFGLTGLIFFFITLLQTSFFFSRLYDYKGKFLLFIVMVFITISYSIIFLPLIMCFWIYRFFDAIPSEEKKWQLTRFSINNS